MRVSWSLHIWLGQQVTFSFTFVEVFFYCSEVLILMNPIRIFWNFFIVCDTFGENNAVNCE